MPEAPRRGAIEVIRSLLPYTSIALGIAVLYASWVLVSRWLDRRHLEQAAEAQRVERYKQDAALYGTNVRILSFYAMPAPLARGNKAQVCYGVANAKTVEIDPPVERVWPSLSHCLEVAPVKDTRYTLTARDAAGHAATKSFELKVN